MVISMTEKIKLYNALETIVEQTLQQQLHSLNLSCTCKRCQMDVMALALNRLPAKYVVQDVGVPFIKAQYMDDQSQANVLKVLAEAATIVSKNCHHN